MRRSAYAVTVQMAISASNYAVFVAFARRLDAGAFVAFSTAVGLNLLAYAIAEGGISYIAPRELSTELGRRAGTLAGAYLTLTATLYLTAIVAGFFLWNALASDPLSGSWTVAYASFVLPSLLLPSWVTCWSLDVVGAVATLAARGAIVVAAALLPGPATLAASGAGFLVVVAWLFGRLNRAEPIVTWCDTASLRTAARQLRSVFVAKTASYAVYGLAPMIVGVTRGSFMASDYVTGERLKSLYAALFQPVVQTAYLAQFRKSMTGRVSRRLATVVHMSNIALCAGLLVATQRGLLGVLGPRFEAVLDVPVYLVAAGLSVASAAILYFRVFRVGAFGTFRFATAGQMASFLAMFALIALAPDAPVAWVLGVAEASLLVALLTRSAVDRTHAVEPSET